jgi:DNA-3-methyladenine glycosylase I
VAEAKIDDLQTSTLVRGADGKAWCTSAPEYEAYHDDEWGRPVADDNPIYEKLCLEGFQSGLSWENPRYWEYRPPSLGP